MYYVSKIASLYVYLYCNGIGLNIEKRFCCAVGWSPHELFLPPINLRIRVERHFIGQRMQILIKLQQFRITQFKEKKFEKNFGKIQSRNQTKICTIFLSKLNCEFFQLNFLFLNHILLIFFLNYFTVTCLNLNFSNLFTNYIFCSVKCR